VNNSIIIKSFQNGISVSLDPDTDFQELINEIEEKFQQTGKFFKDAKVALSLTGRNLTDSEEKQIVDAIMHNSSLTIICLVGKDEDNRHFMKSLQKLENRNKANEGQFFRGTLKEGQTLESETSLTIIGDICKGATVMAMKDIIVLGSIYGKAYAGDNGKSGHFIYALEMNPEVLQIGDIKYRPTKSSLWTKKSKNESCIAYVSENKVIMEQVSKDIMNKMQIELEKYEKKI